MTNKEIVLDVIKRNYPNSISFIRYNHPEDDICVNSKNFKTQDEYAEEVFKVGSKFKKFDEAEIEVIHKTNVKNMFIPCAICKWIHPGEDEEE